MLRLRHFPRVFEGGPPRVWRSLKLSLRSLATGKADKLPAVNPLDAQRAMLAVFNWKRRNSGAMAMRGHDNNTQTIKEGTRREPVFGFSTDSRRRRGLAFGAGRRRRDPEAAGA